MTLIVTALERIARECSVSQPTNWVNATGEEHVSIRDDFLLEAVHDILTRVDLPSPIGVQTTITGTGVEDYALPTAFVRLQRDPLAVYETTTNRRACVPVKNDGEWTHIKEIGTAGTERYYRLKGYEANWEISFYQNPGTGISITVSYITGYWMATSGGTVGTAFTAADDVLILPRRAVETGTVWRFRKRNGLPYQDEFMEYEQELNRLSNDSRTRRRITIGGGHAMRSPWDIPVPDYIPEA